MNTSFVAPAANSKTQPSPTKTNSTQQDSRDKVKSRFLKLRFTGLVVFSWMASVFSLFGQLKILSKPFLHFGPSEHLFILETSISTWGQWIGIMLYVILDQFVCTYGQNNIPLSVDELCRYIGKRSKYTRPRIVQVFIIQTIWIVYYWLHWILQVHLAFSQIDFLLMMCLVHISILSGLAYQKLNQDGVIRPHRA